MNFPSTSQVSNSPHLYMAFQYRSPYFLILGKKTKKQHVCKQVAPLSFPPTQLVLNLCFLSPQFIQTSMLLILKRIFLSGKPVWTQFDFAKPSVHQNAFKRTIKGSAWQQLQSFSTTRKLVSFFRWITVSTLFCCKCFSPNCQDHLPKFYKLYHLP